jgi:hypothetical protein
MSPTPWVRRARARRNAALLAMLCAVVATAGPASMPGSSGSLRSQTHAKHVAQTHARLAQTHALRS